MNIFKNKEFVQELQGEADLFEQLIIKLTLYSYKKQKHSSSQIRIAWKLVHWTLLWQHSVHIIFSLSFN